MIFLSLNTTNHLVPYPTMISRAQNTNKDFSKKSIFPFKPLKVTAIVPQILILYKA